MKTRKVKVTTLITNVVEHISVVEIPFDETNESIVRDIEGKISPANEQTLEKDLYDASAKVVSIVDFNSAATEE
jgi:hypothetical protein